MKWGRVVILAIDPGVASTGWAAVFYRGGRFKTLDYGCIRTKADLPRPLRLRQIYDEIIRLVRRYQPDEMVMEQLFFNTNVRTAMAVGQAEGVILLAAAKSKLPVTEYTPLQVKQAVVGYGRAQKQQVQEMVKTLLTLKELPRPDDAADALALAICHGHCLELERKKRKVRL